MRGNPFALRDFSGGLNFRADAFSLKPGETQQTLDFTPNQGSLRARAGDQTFSADMGAVAHQPPFIGTANMLVALTNGNLLVINLATGAVTTTLRSGLTGTPLINSFVKAPANGGQGPIYFTAGDATNANRVALQYNGTAVAAWTASSGTLPAKARFLTVAGNRVWAANIPGSGTADEVSTVQWSDIGNPRAWPAENINMFGPGDGKPITGIGTLDSYVVIFKSDQAWIIYDLDTGANRPLTTGAGHVLASDTVYTPTPLETPHGLVFLDPDQGPMITDGSKVQRFGYRLGDDVLPANGMGCSFAYYNDRLQVAIAASDDPVEYDFATDSWWRHHVQHLAGGFIASGVVNGVQTLYGTRGSSGNVIDKLMVDGVLSYVDASLVRPVFTTAFINGGSDATRKRFRGIRINGRGHIVSASVALDQASYLLRISNVDLSSSEIDYGGFVDAPGLGVGHAASVLVIMQGLPVGIPEDVPAELNEIVFFAQGRTR